MGQYNMCDDFMMLIAGTNNTYTKEYREAVEATETDNTKTMKYLKNFITSIENISKKAGVKDPRISESRGVLMNFSGYENIKFAIDYLNENAKGIPLMRDIIAIHDKLIANQSKYSDAYDQAISLIILEYESGVYLLTTGLSMIIANNIEFVQDSILVKIKRINKSTHGVIDKTINNFAKQITNKDHDKYLDELIKAATNQPVSESVYMTENVFDILQLVQSIWNNMVGVGKTIGNAFKAVKKSLFGIIPLIRSILYLRYKKKADTVNKLDEQCAFIKQNIEQLQNRTNIDPKKKAEIIKKQQAYIMAYQKKAEKLRAELMEQEKDASVAMSKEDPELKKTNDDEFVLEGKYITSDDFFMKTHSIEMT